MFGILKSLLSYWTAAAVAAVVAGVAGYQILKPAPPPAAVEAPAPAANRPDAAVSAIGSPSQGAGGPQAALSPQATSSSVSSPNAPAAVAKTPADAKSPADAPSSADSKGASALHSPEFDVVRVEPTGDAVVAGRAAPNSKVVLLNKGVEIASAQADANGQFVILPPPLPPGDHILGLGAGQPNGQLVSPQNVTVSVPKRGGVDTLVVLSTPGQPTKILSDTAKPTPAQPAPAGPPGDVAIRSVEVDDRGGFYATGTAKPGATVQLYLNEAPLASVKAGEDRAWSLRVQKGMTGGSYRVRADVIDPAKGEVVARAEAPFDYPDLVAAPPLPPVRPADLGTASTANPTAVAGPGSQATSPEATAAKATASAPAAGVQTATAEKSATARAAPATPADAIVNEVQTVTVTRGDNLWRISRKILGQGVRYTQIYEANVVQIRNPRLIYPNQIFVVPGATAN